MIDQFREKPRESLVRVFPANSGDEQVYAPPAMIRRNAPLSPFPRAGHLLHCQVGLIAYLKSSCCHAGLS
jgi:hypothetical protein